MGFLKRNRLSVLVALCTVFLAGLPVLASEADLPIPDFKDGNYYLLLAGILVCLLGMLFGVYEFLSVKKLKAHKSMLAMGETIFNTCKTYLIQQGKFLIILDFHRNLHCLLFRFSSSECRRRCGHDSCVVGHRNTRFVRCRMVRYQDEYACQHPDGLCFT